jgi:hypothetical protein
VRKYSPKKVGQIERLACVNREETMRTSMNDQDFHRALLNVESQDAPPISPALRQRLLSTLGAKPVQKPWQRVGLAAAVTGVMLSVLVIGQPLHRHFLAADAPTPAYEVYIATEATLLGSAQAGNEDVVHIVASAMLDITLRPLRMASGPLSAQAYYRAQGGAEVPWPVHFTEAPRGTFHLRGPLHELLPVKEGACELKFVISSNNDPRSFAMVRRNIEITRD